MKKEAMQAEALTRAVQGQSLSNYPAIFLGFMEKGIPEHDIQPRENVFTFNAWKALGRVVCKGEHGVKVTTFIEFGPKKPDPETGESDSRKQGGRRPRSTTVFHISQTKPLNGDDEAPKPDNTRAESQASQDSDTGAGEEFEPGTQAEQDAVTGSGETETLALETITPEPIDCPHTQRRVAVGMPCVACGDTMPDDYSEVIR